MDRYGTTIATTTSMNESQRIAKKHPGATIERTAGATAMIELNGKKYKTPSDFQNTDCAVYERNGTARRMHDEGHDAETLTPEAIAEFEAAEEEREESADAWLYY